MCPPFLYFYSILFYPVLFYPLCVLWPDPPNWNETESPSNSQLRVYSQYPNMKELLQMLQFDDV